MTICANTFTYGYAVTVHAAQGVTFDTTHAVLSDRASRAGAYVALTRGCDTNTIYLWEKVAGKDDHEHAENTAGAHVARRGTSREPALHAKNSTASDLIRGERGVIVAG